MEININRILTELEIIFNVAGSIPLTNVASGAVRAIASVGHLAIAGTFTTGGIVGLGVTRAAETMRLIKTMSSSEESTAYYVTKNSSEHMLHSSLNIIRGVGEVLLGWTIVPLVYQIASENRFAPIVKYSK